MAQTTGKKTFPRRGDVFWANLDPTVGNETKKTRPVLIVSNNLANEFSNLVQIAPITSQIKKIYPFEVETIVDGRPAKIMLNQCRAIDKTRLGSKITNIDRSTLFAVEDAIRIVFGLPLA